MEIGIQHDPYKFTTEQSHPYRFYQQVSNEVAAPPDCVGMARPDSIWDNGMLYFRRNSI